VQRAGERRRILFAPNIPLPLVVKSSLDVPEWYYWKELVELYAQVSDDCIDAMASCRNSCATAHSLWIQFVSWKRFVGRIVDKLQSKPTSALSLEELNQLKIQASAAAAAVSQLGIKAGYQRAIDSFATMVRDASRGSELFGRVPHIGRPPVKDIGALCAQMQAAGSILKNLHGLTSAFLCRLRLADGNADVQSLEKHLSALRSEVPRIGATIGRLHRLWYNKSERDIGLLLRQTIDRVFEKVEGIIQLPVSRPSPHYRSFIDEYYPLPKEHFTPGY
jgi:hypothetical protein